jgi:hypothetical protein
LNLHDVSYRGGGAFELSSNEGRLSSSDAEAVESAVPSFVKTNYYAIVDQCYKKTQEYNVDNVPKKEQVIISNVYKDAPVLRDEFKRGLTSRYLKGSRPDEPDWFFKGKASTRTISVDG